MIKHMMVFIRSIYPHFYYFMAFILLACSPSDNKTSILGDALEEDFCVNIHRDDNISLTSELEGVSQLMQDKTGIYDWKMGLDHW